MIHIIYVGIIVILLLIIHVLMRSIKLMKDSFDEIKNDKKYWDDYMKR